MFDRFLLELRSQGRIYWGKAKHWLAVPKQLIIFVAVLFSFLWLSGFITQFPHNKDAWQAAGGYMSGQTMRIPTLNPFVCLWTLLVSGRRMSGLLLTGGAMVAFGIMFYFRYNEPGAVYDAERDFYYSKQGLYGTSGWMEKNKITSVLDVTPQEQVASAKGDILGEDEEGNVFSLPVDTFMNRHVAVYGASGTMKSRAYARNVIITSAQRGESLVITDPKGELAEDTAEYLRKKGYEVRFLNLVNPERSNRWNYLLEIEREGDLMAQTIANVTIQNTGGPKPDHFWDSAEMNLLKALMLYVAGNKKITTSMPRAYQMLTEFDQLEDLTALFNVPTTPPTAKAPYNLFLKASENVRGNVMIGLGSRLQVFQNKEICRMTEENEIDLEAPVKRKCAYYCILSDTDSSLNFISSLFFSLLFIKMTKCVDTQFKGSMKGKSIPVRFVLDEFPNIGQIPDFCKKISTIRSRKLNVSVIFQNIGQLQNRYPDGQWEEILGNCDTQLFLGCTDLTSAEYISKRGGIVSVLSNTQAKERNELTAVEYQPQYRESKTIGKRNLLNPDEVLTLPIERCLIILRGQKMLKAHKFDFTKHPQSALFEPMDILRYNPLTGAVNEQAEAPPPPDTRQSTEFPNTTVQPVSDRKPKSPAKEKPPAKGVPPESPKPPLYEQTYLQLDGRSMQSDSPEVPRRKIDLSKTIPAQRRDAPGKPDILGKKNED